MFPCASALDDLRDPSDLEILCIQDSHLYRHFLMNEGEISEGVCVWMMPCQDLLLHSSTVFVKTVTFFLFFLTDLCDGRKAAPRIGCSSPHYY